MHFFSLSCLLLFAASGSSWAVSGETGAMESCAADQKAVLEIALGKSALAPKNIRVSLGPDECRQIEKGKMLAFAVFIPLRQGSIDEDTSIQDRQDRDFKFITGLFDLKRRRIVASHSTPFPSSGWIEIYGQNARVHPISYGTGKNAAFAISHGADRSANAADFHVSEELTLFMRSGTSLLPVLRSVPLTSTIALTQGGGRCCAHVLLQVTRKIIPTAHRNRGMPNLEIRAERELVVDESRGPLPGDLAKAPMTYSYNVQFDGKQYLPVNSKVADPWDDLDR